MWAKILPDERLDSIHKLDLEGLWACGIRGIIFDLDNTLGPQGFAHLDRRTLEFLEAVKARGFLIGFLSNNEGEGREGIPKEYPIVFRAGKPRVAGFREMLGKLRLSPRAVAMVGDQLFTDIWGAKRVGLYTILVLPVAPDHEGPFMRLRRWLERQILRLPP